MTERVFKFEVKVFHFFLELLFYFCFILPSCISHIDHHKIFCVFFHYFVLFLCVIFVYSSVSFYVLPLEKQVSPFEFFHLSVLKFNRVVFPFRSQLIFFFFLLLVFLFLFSFFWRLSEPQVYLLILLCFLLFFFLHCFLLLLFFFLLFPFFYLQVRFLLLLLFEFLFVFFFGRRFRSLNFGVEDFGGFPFFSVEHKRGNVDYFSLVLRQSFGRHFQLGMESSPIFLERKHLLFYICDGIGYR